MLFLCFLKRERVGWCGMWSEGIEFFTLHYMFLSLISSFSFSFFLFAECSSYLYYLSIKGNTFVFCRFVFSVSFSFSWLVFIFSLFWWLIYIQDSWTHRIKIQRLLIPSRTLFSVFVFSENFVFVDFVFNSFHSNFELF